MLRSVMKSDFIVSMPKVKTHHWVGVTLGMKKLFAVCVEKRMPQGYPAVSFFEASRAIATEFDSVVCSYL
jgi:uncharacterized protein (DUF362 family)